ncbi:MAG: hypothetical protein ABSA26_13895, partial [Thermoguttaceae bacterium]
MTVNFKRIFPVCAIAAMLVLIEFVANADRTYAVEYVTFNSSNTDATLDKILSTAMEKNPDILTAKAKVVLAQAELNAIRLQVARQVVSQWNSLESQRAINDLNQAAYKSGNVPFKEAEESKSKLHQLEAELHYLCGGGEIAGIK